MGRTKSFGRKKTRGNQFKVNSYKKVPEKNLPINNINNSANLFTPSESVENNFTSQPVTKKSASERKLSSCSSFLDTNEVEENKTNLGYQLVDLDVLSEAIKSFVQCKFCQNVNCVSIYEKTNKRKGLACSLLFSCESCGNELEFCTSKNTSYGHEVNVRFVYGMRSIGKGQAGGEALCAVMNLPKPPTRFNNYNKSLLQCIQIVSEKCMTEAADEAVKENDGNINIPGAVDGTWQKRGHTSLNGVVTITSVDTGKVLDVECLTKYCHGCKKTGLDESYMENCCANYTGTSGGMEPEGALRIFQRSLEKRGVRYTKFLGDGDSKAYSKIVAAKPYGEDINICKLECIGHVHKRMGSRLRRLVQTMKAKGKPIGGQNKLSGTEIDRFQQYYSKAIRENTGNLQKMKEAVWATFFHRMSTDTNPMHHFCGSWCKYNKDSKHYKHHGLPENIILEIKSIFQDLAHPDLLRKCLHGKTQNVNESFNNIIWTRVSKNIFVGSTALKLGVHDAVITFNMGNVGKIKVLQQLGIQPGLNTVTQLRAMDKRRLEKADIVMKMLLSGKGNGNKATKRTLDDMGKEDYEAGAF